MNSPWNASMNRIACMLLFNEMSEDGDKVMMISVVAQQVICYDWCVIYVAKFKSWWRFFLAVLIIKISTHVHRHWASSELVYWKIQFWCEFNYFITSTMQNLLWQAKQLLAKLLSTHDDCAELMKRRWKWTESKIKNVHHYHLLSCETDVLA